MKRTDLCLSVAAIGSGCFIGLAAAAEMTGAEIKELISGKTVYLELTASVTGTNGKGVMYYDPNGTIIYKTPKGDTWHGTWAIKGNTACNDWKELPNNACTKYDKQGDTITNINVQTGQTRGKIVKTAPGNVENLTP
jgi:arabinogalactan endo-1,4-beta-galactosidase